MLKGARQGKVGYEDKGENKGEWREQRYKSGCSLLGEPAKPGDPVPTGSGHRSASQWEAMGRRVLLTLLFMTCVPIAKVLLMESERLPLTARG